MNKLIIFTFIRTYLAIMFVLAVNTSILTSSPTGKQAHQAFQATFSQRPKLRSQIQQEIITLFR